jgi:chromosome segregation ATPase
VQQNEHLDIARLRVRSAAVEEENKNLKEQLKAIAQKHEALQATARARDAEAKESLKSAHRKTAEQIAEMEHQVESYKSQLTELSRSAKILSQDNIALSTEVMQLRQRLSEENEHGSVLEGRVGQLQVRALADILQTDPAS